ncbi:hypothetical protein ACSNN9_27250 [Micromonospora sp. URMC 107]|uniref:hypothetical protein n=1 Tax=Micromonospora sp. URMC 107 TaxID=3423418 RepID=UPI003F1D87C9
MASESHEPRHEYGGAPLLADGEALLAPSVTRRLIAEFARVPAARRGSGRLDGVTRRERRR